MTVCVCMKEPVIPDLNSCWSTVNSVVCTSVLSCLEQQVYITETWPSTLLFYSSCHHTPRPLICTSVRDRANIQWQQISQLTHYEMGHRLCVSVYRGDYVRHQTVSDRQHSFHTWGDVELTAETPVKGGGLFPGNTLVNNRHTWCA